MTPLETYAPLETSQRFFDTRGFGGPVAAGVYTTKPPYPATTDGESTTIRAIQIGLKIIASNKAGYATAFTSGDTPPNVSQIDYAPGDVDNAIITVPVAPDGTFKIFISADAGIVIDLYGYWR